MKKYERIRRKLISKRDEIEGRLNKVDQDILHTNGAPNPDSGEQAIERENDDVLEASGRNCAFRIRANKYSTCAY